MARKYMRNEDVVKELQQDFQRLENKVMDVVSPKEVERIDGQRGSVPWADMDWMKFVKQWIRGFTMHGGEGGGAIAVVKGLGTACSFYAEKIEESHISNVLYHLATWFQTIEVPRLPDAPWKEFLRAVEEDCEHEYIEPEEHFGCTLGEMFEAVNRQYLQVLRPHLWNTFSPYQELVNHPVVGWRTKDGKPLMHLPHVLSTFAHGLLRYAMWRNEGTGKAGEELPREVGELQLPEDVPFSVPG